MKNFKIWLESEEDAELYFSIGHGDYDDESGLEPDFIVWAFLDGEIKTGKDGTHGSLWGHQRCDKTYKGRYEPETGRITIVSPNLHKAPQWLLDMLHKKFRYITKLYEF